MLARPQTLCQTDTVEMKIEIRSYTTDVRVKLREAMKRVIRAESDASGLPKTPETIQTYDFPSVCNDARVVEKLGRVFSAHFDGDVQEMARDTASDDFSVFPEGQKIPFAHWNFGGTDPETWEEARRKGKLDELPCRVSTNYAEIHKCNVMDGLLPITSITLTDRQILLSYTHRFSGCNIIG